MRTLLVAVLLLGCADEEPTVVEKPVGETVVQDCGTPLAVPTWEPYFDNSDGTTRAVLSSKDYDSIVFYMATTALWESCVDSLP